MDLIAEPFTGSDHMHFSNIDKILFITRLYPFKSQ